MKKIIILILSIFLFVSCGILEERENQKAVDDFMEHLDDTYQQNVSVSKQQNKDNDVNLEKELTYSQEAELYKDYLWVDDVQQGIKNYYNNIIPDIEDIFTINFEVTDNKTGKDYRYNTNPKILDDATIFAEVFIKTVDREWYDNYTLKGNITNSKMYVSSSVEEPDRIILEEARQGDFYAYIERDRWVQRVYVENTKTWNKELLNELAMKWYWNGDRDIFYDIIFYDANILLYRTNYLLTETYLYNIETQQEIVYPGYIRGSDAQTKQMLLRNEYIDDIRFLSDNRYLYACTPGGLIYGIHSIYEYPSLKLIHNIKETFELNEWWYAECPYQYLWETERGVKYALSYYNRADNSLNISASSWYGDTEVFNEYIYDFSTLELNKIPEQECNPESNLTFSPDMVIFWRECPRKWYYSSLIEAYYYTILKDIDTAYDLKHTPDISRENFRELYQNVEDIYVANIDTSIKGNDYYYTADILIKDVWELWFDRYSVTLYSTYERIKSIVSTKQPEKIYPINKLWNKN